MPLPRQTHPTSRASVVSAVFGIILIAVAVVAAVPVALRWPASWPGLIVVVALACVGVALIVRHMSRHRVGVSNAELKNHEQA